MPNFELSREFMRTIEHTVRDRGFRLKHLTRGVKRLSDKFLKDEGPVGDYLILPEQLASYTSYYLPINALKVRWVLEELQRYAPDFLERDLRVLDFGSGPGTATLGLGEVSEREHQVTAVDTVLQALDTASELVKKMTKFRIETATTVPEGTFDLIFAANVLNELETEQELLSLLDRLDPKGYLIIVEPALRDTSQKLQNIRDRLQSDGWNIAAPCLDVPSCPMLAHPTFWCHMEVRWTRPSFIQKLDDRTGLEKETLKFSYLVVTKEGAGRKGTARLVSFLRKEKGKLWGFLCGGGPHLCRADLLKRDLGDGNRDFRNAQRGDVFEIQDYEPGEKARLKGDVKRV